MFKIKNLIIVVFVSLLVGSSLLSVKADSVSQNRNIIRVAVDHYINLNPQHVSSPGNHNILPDVMEGLMRRNGSRIIPGIAYKYTVSKDGLTYTFYLRDAVWSDGKPVKADDFVYAWKRALSPSVCSSQAFLLYDIKNAERYSCGEATSNQVAVKALNDKTLQVVLEKPTPYFIDLTANITFLPFRRDLVEKYKDEYFENQSYMVFNGPFMVDKLFMRHITVVKNPTYWNKSKIKIDGIQYDVIESNIDSSQAYLDDGTDITNMTVNNIESLPKDEIKTYVSGSVGYVQHNLKDKAGILSNLYIRKALSLSIDREPLIKENSVIFATPAYGLIPPEIIPGKSKTFREEAGDLLRNNDVKGAKAALNEGLKQLKLKKLPPITLLVHDSNINVKTANSLVENWKNSLGIDVVIEVVDFREWLMRMGEGAYQMTFNVWRQYYYDALTYLYIFDSNDKDKNCGYQSKAFSTFVKNIKQEKDKAIRIDMLKKAEKKLIDDAVVAPLYYENNKVAVKPYLKNVVIGPYESVYDLTYAEFVPKAKVFLPTSKMSVNTTYYWYKGTMVQYLFPGSDFVIKDSTGEAFGAFYSYDKVANETLEDFYKNFTLVLQSRGVDTSIEDKANIKISGFPAIEFKETAVDPRDKVKKISRYVIVEADSSFYIAQFVTMESVYDMREAELEKMLYSIQIAK